MTLDVMARLVADLPVKLLTMGPSFDMVRPLLCRIHAQSNSLFQLLNLLRDPSLPVQQSAFQLIGRTVQKHIADLVVEVELDTESTATIELPAQLLALVSAKLSVESLGSLEDVAEVSRPRNVSRWRLMIRGQTSTFLLAWLVAFQFFDTAVSLATLCVHLQC